jgi:hypothetical protein
VLYWVRDDVWNQLQSAAQCCGGHVCVAWAEKVLRRHLKLDDLAIDKYLLTAQNEPVGSQPVIIHCVVDTVLGAANQAGVSAPSKWCCMWKEYYELGKNLASQTPNAAQVVAGLINQTETLFPNFRNPYSTE